jgi:hypothetical protein
MGPLANGALCLSTPKHNGKSDTDYHIGLYAPKDITSFLLRLEYI